MLIAAPTVTNAGSVGSSSVTEPYCGWKPHQSGECVKDALGSTRCRPAGTWPAKPGSTGVMPYSRIAARIVF